MLAAIRASKPAWVRVFLGWNGIEPQQGVYNTAEIADYPRFFAALPAGTKIDVDVEGTPAWAASGSSNPTHAAGQRRGLRRASSTTSSTPSTAG